MSSSNEVHASATWGTWKTLIGSSEILFSAPHEFPHMRDGQEKVAERGTSQLAFDIANCINGSAIAITSKLTSDPNWDFNHPYTNEIAKVIKNGVVLDLHIMKDRGFDACMGLGIDLSLVDGLWQKLITELISVDIRTCVGWPFAAGPRTVTSKLQRIGFAAIQLELTPDYYDLESPKYQRIRNALLAFCDSAEVKTKI